MLLSNGILTNEVLRWKAIGAAVWLAAITAAVSVAWSVAAAPAALLSPLRLLGGLLSPTGWLATAALMLAQAPAFVAQAGALRGAEPRPVHAHRLPRLGAAAVVASKLAARCTTALNAARTASFLGLQVLSAMLFLGLDSATRSAAPQGGPVLHGTACAAGPSPMPLATCCCPHACSRRRPDQPCHAGNRGMAGASDMPGVMRGELCRVPAGATWTLLYSLWLAAVYLLHWAYWCVQAQPAMLMLALVCCGAAA